MGAAILLFTVAAVGVLHTLVPDHWAPIAVLARGQGWSRERTARAAALAGFGHVTSTLLLGILVWAVGAAVAVHYSNLVNRAAAFALIAFGAWFALSAWREMRAGHHEERLGHAHPHRHPDGTQHVHWHEHAEPDWHVADGVAVLHEHTHAISGRTALLLILGSSPMIEGLPAFFAAATYGAALLIAMALIFALSTIVTYVVISTLAITQLERLSLGPLERYGEVLSGTLVAIVGVFALLTVI